MATQTTNEKMNSWEQMLEEKARFMSKFSIPEWVLIDCPACGEKISPQDVTRVSYCLDSKALGDLCVEYICAACKSSDCIYLDAKLESFEDIAFFLKAGGWDDIKFKSQREQYHSKENNLKGMILGKNNNR